MLQAQHPLAQGLVRGATAPVHTLRWPTTVTVKPKTSRQKQNTSRQNQKPHGKTKYLTAKTKYFTVKPNTHGKTKAICFCCELFGFAVRFLVLP